jgi:rhodanese-related sulfurtransferase
MKPNRSWAIMALAFLILTGCAEKWSIQLRVPKITKEELKSQLGNPDVIIIDVRVEDEWKEAKWKIQGAVREDSEEDINTWVNKYPKDKTLVFYCS